MRTAKDACLRAAVGTLLVAGSAIVQADPIRIVAAESVYGDIARQIGGEGAAVKSILANPQEDPHEFEAAVATARAVANAQVVIYNGAGYDPWMARLVSAARAPSRQVIEVARLSRKGSDNPHLWYDTDAMSALAATLAEKLGAIDTAHRSEYRERAVAFDNSLQSLRARIAAMRVRYGGTRVAATEPVFQYMADALGLQMRNPRFQLSVMNGTEPGARTIAMFEDDLRGHVVKALIYNTQTDEPLARRMRDVANRAGIPVIPVTETQPRGTTYQGWMTIQLDALERALAGP